MVHEETSTESLPRQRRDYQTGMWAAIVVTIIPILRTGMTFCSIYGGMAFDQFGSRGLLPMMRLFDYLQSGLSLLWALAYIVVIDSLHSYAPPEKRRWVRVGLILAVIYLLVLTFNFLTSFAPNFRFTLFERILPARNSTLRPIAVLILIYALMWFAALFAIPAFTRGGLERAIRWCLGISGVLLIACGAAWVFSPSVQINGMLSTASLLIQLTIFPVATAMIAVAFWRRTKVQPADGLSLSSAG